MLTLLTLALLLVSDITALRGRVFDEADQPVVGAAVRINAAKTKAGEAPVGEAPPGDCGKVAITDLHGHFQFDDVSPDCVYELAAGAQGYRGQVVSDADPDDPDEVEIQLPPLQTSQTDRLLSAQVVDPQGVPVAGVVITANRGLPTIAPAGAPRTRGPGSTVTDADGKFVLVVDSPARRLSLRIRAGDYAPMDEGSLRAGQVNPPVRLQRGAGLMGRLVKDGQPVQGLTLGVVQEDRGIGRVVTPHQVTTDQEGAFRVTHLPAGLDYTLYSLLGQSTDAVLPVSLVTAPGNGMMADLGELIAGDAYRLKVSFVTLGGEAIPTQSYCYLTRARDWHSSRQTIPAASGAEVAFEGVASEVVQLGVRVPGYEVIKTDPFCQIDPNRRFNLRPVGDQSITIALKQSE